MVDFKWDKNTIYRTVEFAEQAHMGQTLVRKNDVPFSCHFVNVMLNAINFLSTEDDVDYTYIIQLALLHDTIEDTNVTYEELYNNFGKRVADGVLALSRDESIDYNDQIADCIKRIKKLEKEVAIVKMADRLYNMRGRVPEPIWTREKQEHYKIEGQLICDELGYACANLKEALQIAINEY